MAWFRLWKRASITSVNYKEAIARSDRALELDRLTGERAGFAPFAVTGMRARIAAGCPADAERWLAGATENLGQVEWYASPRSTMLRVL